MSGTLGWYSKHMSLYVFGYDLHRESPVMPQHRTKLITSWTLTWCFCILWNQQCKVDSLFSKTGTWHIIFTEVKRKGESFRFWLHFGHFEQVCWVWLCLVCLRAYCRHRRTCRALLFEWNCHCIFATDATLNCSVSIVCLGCFIKAPKVSSLYRDMEKWFLQSFFLKRTRLPLKRKHTPIMYSCYLCNALQTFCLFLQKRWFKFFFF